MAEWDQRRLCPDGSCIGVIGADGTCKVCGRAAPGFQGAYRDGPAEPIEDEPEPEEEKAVAALVDKAEEAVHGAEWSERTLCSDGACTGVIGDDGNCKTCGRSAA